MIRPSPSNLPNPYLYLIQAIPLFQDNYCYLIKPRLSPNHLFLVDPANHVEVKKHVDKYWKNHLITHILYTHKHWDHAGQSQQLLKWLKQRQNVLVNRNVQMKDGQFNQKGENQINRWPQIWIGEKDRKWVKTATHQVRNQTGKEEKGKIDTTIQNNKSLNNMNEFGTWITDYLQAFEVPCHTQGHVIYCFRNIGSVLTGNNNNSNNRLYNIQNSLNSQTNKPSNSHNPINLPIVNTLHPNSQYPLTFHPPKQCCFTGDTLFQGGVGKFFEGNASQMTNNLKLIRDMIGNGEIGQKEQNFGVINSNNNNNQQTYIFDGHQYTRRNLEWAKCAGNQVEQKNVKLRIQEILKQQEQNRVKEAERINALKINSQQQQFQPDFNRVVICTLPTTLTRQLKTNLFMRAAILLNGEQAIQEVGRLRKHKDQWKA